MSSAIQVDEGSYTRIHNMILELLSSTHLSALEFKIVLFIIRKTYGFQKKTDRISISQFSDNCKCSRPAVVEALQNLVRLNVITKKETSYCNEYGFNKYYEQWLPEVFETRRPGQIEHIYKEDSKPNATSKPNGTSKPDATRNSKPDATKTSKPDATHKINKEIKESSHASVFSAIARVCMLDAKLKGGMIGKYAKQLVDAGYTGLDVDNFLEWWNEYDFRGKRGERPTIGQLTEFISRSKSVIQPRRDEKASISIILPGGQITEAMR